MQERDSVRLALDVPTSGAVLSGMWGSIGKPSAGTATFGAERVRIQGESMRWKPFRLDLERSGGKRVVVEFRASGGTGFLAGLLMRSQAGALLGSDGRRLDSPSLRLHHDGSVLVYELPGTLPRARLAGHALRAADAGGALYEASGDPAGGRTVFVEAPRDWEGFSVRGRPAAARVTSDSGWRLACEVPGDGLRLLVLADTWEPGWRAYAGERRLSVKPADCMFRAVAVPPGAREVCFFYEPLPFKLGVLAAGLGLGFCLGAMASLQRFAGAVSARITRRRTRRSGGSREKA